MIVFYSGESDKLCRPEVVLGDETNLMLSYSMFVGKKKADRRFRKIIKARRKKHARRQG